MNESVVCIDWFDVADGTTKPQKDWASLRPDVTVVDICSPALCATPFEEVALVVIHKSVVGKSNADYQRLQSAIKRATPVPYVMVVSTQPTQGASNIHNNGRWNTTGVPFPKALAHLARGLEKLVSRLAQITRSSDATEVVQLRIEAWQEWERSARVSSKPALSALFLLCQGYLAIHGGTGLEGWTADHQRRVTARPEEVDKRAWWIEGIFESAAALQESLLDELQVKNIEDVPEEIRDFLHEVWGAADKAIKKEDVQRAFESLSLLHNQK